ncbi:MAG: HIT domain-containing protein [Vicinamibacterales bacterium]
MTRTGDPDGCVFCAAPSSEDGRGLVVHDGPTCFVILNLFPYNGGHLMVVPRRHVAALGALADDELVELARTTRLAEAALNEAFRPQGMNVGMNLGRPAGAGIADHLHVHLVPRWAGDTNFMPVVGNVRVLPEDLFTTAGRLRPIFARLAAAAPHAP